MSTSWLVLIPVQECDYEDKTVVAGLRNKEACVFRSLRLSGKNSRSTFCGLSPNAIRSEANRLLRSVDE